jgi:hypothetical protein
MKDEARTDYFKGRGWLFFLQSGKPAGSPPGKMQGGERRQGASQIIEAMRPVWPLRRHRQ